MWRIVGRGADAGGPGIAFETGAVEVGDAAEAAPSSDRDQGFEFHRVGDLGQLQGARPVGFQRTLDGGHRRAAFQVGAKSAEFQLIIAE